jgi:3-hydroxyisobutyrate dehydrogenase
MNLLFVGLGVMGTAMVRKVAPATTRLNLVDINHRHLKELADELGAVAIAEPTDVVPPLDVVVLMLPHSGIVESVLVGEMNLLAQLTPGAVVVDMGSSQPESTVRLAASAKALGIDYVDAPVSGGIVKAQSGQLTIMVGADQQGAVTRVRPILQTMGEHIIVVGGSGAGHAAKALNNLLGAINLTGAAEVLTVATKFGISPEVMLDVLNVSTGRNQATEFKVPKHVLTRTFASQFALDLMIKDVGIARELAKQLGIELALADAVAEVADHVRQHLGDGADHTEIVRHYELVNELEISPKAQRA